MPEPIQLSAVFTGDSANYHIFQVVGSDDFVGSLYIKKKSENGIPEGVEITFVTPSRDKFLWTKGMGELLDKARSGSKAEQKLVNTMKKYK
jgi:hypothetical protein